MQCGELMYCNSTTMTQGSDSMVDHTKKPEKETIHSGQFMVSEFEAEAQDDEYEVAVPLPGDDTKPTPSNRVIAQTLCIHKKEITKLSIETSLTKLFQCMSLAYRQKLTSPKWNRFKGIRLRWKDKIRLNNVIWRCWHMQFILKKDTLVCQFASPLDVDTHNKPEAVVLEGKYWKRKLAAVTAEYKKWRMFYRNKIMGWNVKDSPDMFADMDIFDWQPHSNDSGNSAGSMLVDEDYMEFMSDTLFSTIQSNQPFAFPDTREIARGAGIADFIQPSLVQLQPNLDDIMDTLEPLHDLLYNSKLPSVPEETVTDNMFPALRDPMDNSFADIDMLSSNGSILSSQISANTQKLTSPLYSQSKAQQIYPDSRNVSSANRLERVSSTFTSPVADTNQGLVIQQAAEKSRSQSNSIHNQQSSVFSHKLQNKEPLQSFQAPSTFQNPQQNFSFNSTTLSGGSFKTFPTPVASNSSISSSSQSVKVEKENQVKYRGRSQSGSCLVPNLSSRQHPPLAPSVSDPSIQTTNNCNVQPLLAQLLTNNQTSVFSFTASDRLNVVNNMLKPSPGPVPILPAGVSQANTVLIATPMPPFQCSIPSVRTGNTAQSPLLGTVSSPKSITPSQSLDRPQVTIDSSRIPAQSLDRTPLPLENPRLLRTEPQPPKENRRMSHINAEQKRRCNIKNGFDMLQSLIPHLNQNPNAKLSKAAMLQKGAEYIQQLRAERDVLREEMHSLKQEIESLNTSISNCQSLLPATGAPVSRQRASKMKEMFDDYVRMRTLENWKFWIFSILIEPLLTSYNSSVSTTSLDDLYRSTLNWVEQHCSLVDLRPAVLSSLRYLSRTTDILSDPSKLPEEARRAVMKQDRQ